MVRPILCSFHILGGALSFGGLACQSVPPTSDTAAASASVDSATNTELVAVQLPAHGQVPALDLEVGITPAADAQREVKAIADSTLGAVRACHAQARSPGDLAIALDIAVAKQAVTSASPAPASAFGRCLASALKARPWAGTGVERSIVVRIHLSGGPP